MAETASDTQYPLLIFVVGLPGSFAQEIGQRLAHEYGFFFIGVAERFERAMDERVEATMLSQREHNDRHARLPFVLSEELEARMADFLQHTKHLARRPCLVIEGYPRCVDQVPAFCKAAQRLLLVCECPQSVAEQRAVGHPHDWDCTAPATSDERDASGWNATLWGLSYLTAKSDVAAQCAEFEHTIPALFKHFETATTTNAVRAISRPLVLSESLFTPGKVLVLDTSHGDEDDCWARADEALQKSLEFRTLLAEIEADFETMADDEEDAEEGEGKHTGDNDHDDDGYDADDEKAVKKRAAA